MEIAMAPQSFEDLRWIADLMETFPHPWFIAGGWAIDLHVGRITRSHEDAEIAVLRRDQKALRDHLEGWTLQHATPGAE
ncbi:MAG: hypothetical protein R3291_00440, partial [Thermoplasmata archaeon]|nr:hypothetical protein [Thermoplasmata archaeon]